MVILFLSVFTLAQGLAFSEEMTIYEVENYGFTQFSRVCPNGNILLVYNKTYLGAEVPHFELFTPDYQALWEKPIPVRELAGVAIKSDNTIAIVRKTSNCIAMDSYDQDGARIEHLSNINITNMRRVDVTIVPDGMGGLHLIDTYSKYYGYHYGYINSAGELSATLYFNMDGEDHYNNTDALLANDGGVVFALTGDYGFTIYCISNSHNSYQTISHSSDELIKGLKLAKASDGSFYAGWTEGDSAMVRRFSSTGSWSWDQPWIKAPSYAVQLEGLAVSALDRVIVHYQKLDETLNNIRRGHHCVDLITSFGEPLYSYAPATSDPGEKTQHNSKIVVDDDGGWYFIAYRGDYRMNPDNYILHFNSYCSPWTIAQHVPMSGVSSLVFHAFQEDNALKLSYLTYVGTENDDGYADLNYQKIDSAGNLSYPENGFQIKRGRRVTFRFRKSLALKDGSLFTCWMPYNPVRLFYQVITPDGEKLYPEAQSLELGQYAPIELFETEDNKVIVATRNSYYLEMHKIDPRKGDVWGEGVRIAGCIGFAEYEGAILAARKINNEIYVQRYVDGYPVWHGDGVLMAKLNPNYDGDVLCEARMCGNHLIWGQRSSNVTTMSFINSITSSGLPSYSPDSAKELVELTGDYVGCRVSSLYQDNGRWVMQLSLLYWDWGHQGGPSYPPVWMLKDDNIYQVYSDDFSPLYEIVNQYSNKLCIQDDAYFSYYEHSINKYNLDSELVWSAQISRYKLRQPVILKDGRLLWYGSTGAAAEDPNAFHYGFIDQDGVVSYPEDSRVSILPYETIAETDYGIYFVLCPPSYQGWYLQYLPLKTWEPSQGGETPAPRIELKNYPNPFNPITNIIFKLDEASETKLQIFNLKGQLVKTLLDGYLPAGRHYWLWDATDAKERNLSSGVYFCRVQTKYQSKVIKMMLMK